MVVDLCCCSVTFLIGEEEGLFGYCGDLGFVSSLLSHEEFSSI